MWRHESVTLRLMARRYPCGTELTMSAACHWICADRHEPGDTAVFEDRAIYGDHSLTETYLWDQPERRERRLSSGFTGRDADRRRSVPRDAIVGDARQASGSSTE